MIDYLRHKYILFHVMLFKKICMEVTHRFFFFHIFQKMFYSLEEWFSHFHAHLHSTATEGHVLGTLPDLTLCIYSSDCPSVLSPLFIRYPNVISSVCYWSQELGSQELDTPTTAGMEIVGLNFKADTFPLKIDSCQQFLLNHENSWSHTPFPWNNPNSSMKFSKLCFREY